MSDTTLNRFLAQGTNAERLAFTPNPPTPASGPDPGYFFYVKDTGDSWTWDTDLADWVQVTSGSPFTNPMTTSQDLIVGGAAGAPGRLAVGSPGRVLTVGSGGLIDWEVTAPVGGSITASGYTMATAKMLGRATAGTGAIEEIAVTGSGSAVLATSPTLVTPALGTPSALVLTNATGLPVGSITGLAANVATFLATPSSANLLAAVTDETGTGKLVFATAPTFASTMTIGTAAGTTGAINFVGTTSGLFTMTVAAAAGTWTATWPATAGSNTNVLTTNGSGVLSWAAAGAGGVQLSDSPTWTGIHTWTPAARSSGSAAYFTINSPADTAITAATEAIGISIPGSTRQHASNTTVPSQREIVIGGPVYSFASATGTINDAITLSVSAPTAGTNAILTRRTAISIPDGGIAFGTIGTQGTITSAGSTGNLAITAGGTDQNITINPSGTGIICYGTPSAVLPTAAFGLFGSSDQTARTFIRRASADAFGSFYGITKSRGTMASPATLNSGDNLGGILWGGHDGTSWNENQARMQVESAEAWTTSARGTRIKMFLTVNGTTASSATPVIQLDNDLSVTFGSSIKTSAPSSGTAAYWKLGILVTTASVFDTTRYIQLDVGGTLYKLAVCT